MAFGVGFGAWGTTFIRKGQYKKLVSMSNHWDTSNIPVEHKLHGQNVFSEFHTLTEYSCFRLSVTRIHS